MTILFGDASWCVQGRQSIATQGLIPTQQPVTPQERDSPSPAPGQSKNEVRELECVILFWSIKVLVNSGSATPDPFITFRLRRNQSTILDTIDFEPLETGTKAHLLSIPILPGENFDFQIEQFGSGNTEFTWLFAGKLGGQPSPPPVEGQIGFNVNSTLYSQYQDTDLYGSVTGVPPPVTNAELIFPFQNIGSESRFRTGLNPLDPLIATGNTFAGATGRIKRIRMDITKNTLNKDITISLYKNLSVLNTVFTILAGQTGSFIQNRDTLISVGEKWAYHFQTTDQINATGNITFATAMDVEWGFA